MARARRPGAARLRVCTHRLRSGAGRPHARAVADVPGGRAVEPQVLPRRRRADRRLPRPRPAAADGIRRHQHVVLAARLAVAAGEHGVHPARRRRSGLPLHVAPLPRIPRLAAAAAAVVPGGHSLAHREARPAAPRSARLHRRRLSRRQDRGPAARAGRRELRPAAGSRGVRGRGARRGEAGRIARLAGALRACAARAVRHRVRALRRARFDARESWISRGGTGRDPGGIPARAAEARVRGVPPHQRRDPDLGQLIGDARPARRARTRAHAAADPRGDPRATWILRAGVACP